MFESKAGVYPSGDPKDAPFYGRLLALPTNMRLGYNKHSTLLGIFLNYSSK
jgi:hypothetical protein